MYLLLWKEYLKFLAVDEESFIKTEEIFVKLVTGKLRWELSLF